MGDHWVEESHREGCCRLGAWPGCGLGLTMPIPGVTASQGCGQGGCSPPAHHVVATCGLAARIPIPLWL